MKNEPLSWLRPLIPVALTVSIVLAVLAHFYSRFPGDLSITLWLQSFHDGVFLSVMQSVSWLFDGWRTSAMVVAGFLVILLLSERREALIFGIAGAATSVSSLLKALVGRPRPSPALVQVLDLKTNGSFPSGHALFVTVVLGFTAYLCIKHIGKRRLRYAAAGTLAALIIITGISRIYLGAHWASDVLGGYLTGGFILSLAVWTDLSLETTSGPLQ